MSGLASSWTGPDREAELVETINGLRADIVRLQQLCHQARLAVWPVVDVPAKEARRG